MGEHTAITLFNSICLGQMHIGIELKFHCDSLWLFCSLSKKCFGFLDLCEEHSSHAYTANTKKDVYHISTHCFKVAYGKFVALY